MRRSFAPSAVTALTGAAAYPASYRNAGPGGYSMIHFAAHAVANAESPLDSAVILSRFGDDYKLYARDVMACPLRANLVTISACRGAGAKTSKRTTKAPGARMSSSTERMSVGIMRKAAARLSRW